MIGLVVNPVAGVGGPAGLKGSDGHEIQASARARGSARKAGERAARALAVIARSHPDAVIATAAGEMGEDAVLAAGLDARVVYAAASETTAADTTAAAAAIAANADLLLFVGGDGTARDVWSGIPVGFAALGVPAGVKMYSACFAVSPAAAGAVATAWTDNEVSGLPLRECEVLDVVEEQLRFGRIDPRLFGTMMVPYAPGRTQSRKAATPASGHDAVVGAADGLVALLIPEITYLLGPGSTLAEVARQLGVASTLLGVDVLRGGEIVLADASEQQLLDALAAAPGDAPAQAVVTVIGGQGFLLGRGNQQISATVLKRLGANPLLVVATEDKLLGLAGRPLLVDTGDPQLDASLVGYARVITGPDATSLYPVQAPESAVHELEVEGARTCV